MAESFQEKQQKKVAILKARLQKEEARLNHRLRKDRTGQLVAAGVLVEQVYKTGDTKIREQLKEWAEANLKDRNLERTLAMFARLETED